MLLPRNHHLQMSSCLSGGGRAYAFELEIIKPPSSPATARGSNSSSSSSPSSTLSESGNSGLAITTRRARTPRKRPNQTYNEAAALLSSAYPNLFAADPNHKSPSPSPSLPFSDDSSELFFPFPERLGSRFRPKFSCPSPGEIDSRPNFSSGSSSSMELTCNYDEDFDAESILDEEVDEGGIDSIMGNLAVAAESAVDDGATCYGFPMGLGLGLELGLGFGIGGRGVGVRALRHADEGNWWSFPAVDMVELSRRFRKSSGTKKKMKKVERERVEAVEPPAAAMAEASKKSCLGKETKEAAGLLLKLNYDGVLNAWSDKGSPFSDESPATDVAGNDVAARLAQIDLFPESGGVREASVLRYKEKRRTRLFSKKIRYQVRKVNADQRPRMKGRFVRRPNSKHDDYGER